MNETDKIKIIVPWNGEIETSNGMTAATIATHIAAHDHQLREALLLSAYISQDDSAPESLSISILGDESCYQLKTATFGSEEYPRDALTYSTT